MKREFYDGKGNNITKGVIQVMYSILILDVIIFICLIFLFLCAIGKF